MRCRGYLCVGVVFFVVVDDLKDSLTDRGLIFHSISEMNPISTSSIHRCKGWYFGAGNARVFVKHVCHHLVYGQNQ